MLGGELRNYQYSRKEFVRIVIGQIYTLEVAKYGKHGRYLCWTVLVNYRLVKIEGSNDVFQSTFQMPSLLQSLSTTTPSPK